MTSQPQRACGNENNSKFFFLWGRAWLCCCFAALPWQPMQICPTSNASSSTKQQRRLLSTVPHLPLVSDADSVHKPRASAPSSPSSRDDVLTQLATADTLSTSQTPSLATISECTPVGACESTPRKAAKLGGVRWRERDVPSGARTEVTSHSLRQERVRRRGKGT